MCQTDIRNRYVHFAVINGMVLTLSTSLLIDSASSFQKLEGDQQYSPVFSEHSLQHWGKIP